MGKMKKGAVIAQIILVLMASAFLIVGVLLSNDNETKLTLDSIFSHNVGTVEILIIAAVILIILFVIFMAARNKKKRDKENE